MNDLEKVIRILEGSYKNFVLRHNGELLTVNELIKLLKAQEPRLITNADFENKDLVDSIGTVPAWIEYRHGEEWDEYNDGNDDEWSLVHQSNFESEYYRCWTARPTDEQREATPWE